MQTIISKINQDKNDELLSENKKIYKEAGEILKNGGLVAFPTETVYGLGGNALDENSAKKIYEAKGRPNDNPLIVHICDLKDLPVIASDIPEIAYKLAEHFWPGPLTMIFNKTSLVPYSTTGGLETVAVRMPDNEIAQNIIREAGGFVAAPSANSSGKPSPTQAAHVISDLAGIIDMVVDGGSTTIGLESTIIDLSVEHPTILRPGFITPRDLLPYFPDLIYSSEATETEDSPKAPGMKYKHYAPNAELTIFTGAPEDVSARINSLTEECISKGKSVGIICSKENENLYSLGNIKTIGSLDNDIEIAQSLYSILRSFDHDGADYIFSESFYTNNLGDAIMNRLNKSAGGKIFLCQRQINFSKFNRIIFVEDYDIHRAVLAKYILNSMTHKRPYKASSRGDKVSYSEPLMPKIDLTLKNHGIDASEHISKPLTNQCFNDTTMLITLDAKKKADIIESFPEADNVFTLAEALGSDIQISNPFGKPLSDYEKCFEELYPYIKQLNKLLNI